MRSRSPQFRAAVPNVAALSGAALLLLSLLILAIAPACTGKGSTNPGAQSVERQSDAEYDLARDLFQKGNPRAALDHAMKAITLNEDNDKAQYYVALIHLSFCTGINGLTSSECHLAEVEKYARNALKANAEFRDAKNMLAQVLVDEKKCQEAVTIIEPLTRDPAYVHPYFAWGNLGAAQLCLGQIDAAIASLKNAIAEPRFCVGHYRLGQAYEAKKDYAAAEAAFTNAVTADPECEALQDAWWGRCRVRKQLVNAEWKKDCEKCRDISAQTPTGKLCIALLAANP